LGSGLEKLCLSLCNDVYWCKCFASHCCDLNINVSSEHKPRQCNMRLCDPLGFLNTDTLLTL
jgi:hypothetical protein